ncbi:hypothetical protein Tco_1399170 [Tanacetum coccineum]
MSCEAIEKDIYERILILQEPRPIIETLKFSDQHKKLLDNVLLDKLKLDGEFEIDEEEATEEVIRGYKMIREKNDPGVFVLPIRIEEKFDTHALADTGSNINAEPMGILKDVLCQVGVTKIIAKFMIFDIPVDKDVPIDVGRIRNKHEESHEDKEEYTVKRDKNGKPIYGPKFAKYLNCDDPMDRDGDGKWHGKVRIVDPYGNVYDQGSEKNFIETSGKNDFEAGSSSLPKITLQHETVEEAMLPYEEIFTSEAWRRAFDIREHVCAELCHEFYATYEFDETVTDEELMSRKENIFALSSDKQCGIHGSFREFLRE